MTLVESREIASEGIDKSLVEASEKERIDAKLKKTLKVAKKAAKRAEKSLAELGEPSKKKGPSVRERIFKILEKAEFGFSRKEVMMKLHIRDTQNVFRDEGLSEKPRIKRTEVPGVRGMVYSLTPRGRRAIENGTIDSEKAPSLLGNAEVRWKDGLLENSGRPRGRKNKVAAK